MAGYLLDIFQETPIIKRIATSSFTQATGGWCFLGLAFLYYWIDVLNHKRFLKFFTIVGMNSIFIYLFFEIVVRWWLYDYVNLIMRGAFAPLGISSGMILFIGTLCLFSLQWYLCYWLYKRKIFFKV